MRYALVIACVAALGWSPVIASAAAADYPQSLEREAAGLRERVARESANVSLLIELARVQLALGEDLYTEREKKVAAFEEGARVAKRAWELQETNAEAHYLYAANLGSAADIKGIAASLLSLDDIKAHVRRAVTLKPDHPAALHMAGQMLEDMPQFLGGNPTAALDYLKRAVAADPSDSHARLDLGKMYLKRKDQEAAKRELLAVVRMEHPTDRYSWERRHRPEAEQLLVKLEGSGGTPPSSSGDTPAAPNR
jgi:tetratricopeptide (TPR) repeat protein